jgi:23S rRNA (uracil1939-C5)-methyltransferase
MTFRVSAGSFFQINRSVTLQMLAYMETLLLQQMDSLIDLYAGVGLFALWFHARSNRVVAIESSPVAMADAHTNLALNHAPNITMIPGHVEQQLASLEDTFEVAIVDPPRNGCDPVVLTWINTHVTRQILYVSCNPATLARDLKTLHAAGWQIDTVQPFDMFPQTYHIETVVSLTRGEHG